jgi:hypothetical protein
VGGVENGMADFSAETFTQQAFDLHLLKNNLSEFTKPLS